MPENGIKISDREAVKVGSDSPVGQGKTDKKSLLPEKEEVKKESGAQGVKPVEIPVGPQEVAEWSPKPKSSAFLKKVAPIILVFSILAFALAYYKRQNDRVISEPVGGVFPTLPPFQQYRPSVYADDPLILQLEKDINVLDRELSNVQIKEILLEPPKFDFNISF